jgi:type I restriction enzyme, R subunit
VCQQHPCVCRRRTHIKLADGKARNIQHMMSTTFWHPDGAPISAQQFMELLYGKLPDFFSNEEELRALWSAPDTRRKLLDGLATQGFGLDQLAEMQQMIEAEQSDLFDVLAYIAYARAPLSREARAAQARLCLTAEFSSTQRAFLDFVLQHYVDSGVQELDTSNLGALLKLRYKNSIPDAVADLGPPHEISDAFNEFQRHLYEPAA